MHVKHATRSKRTVFGRAVKNTVKANMNLRKSRKSGAVGFIPSHPKVELNPEEAAIMAAIDAKYNEPADMKAAISRMSKLDKDAIQRLKKKVDWLYPEKNFRRFHAAKR